MLSAIVNASPETARDGGRKTSESRAEAQRLQGARDRLSLL
jgi:hypothetical protein